MDTPVVSVTKADCVNRTSFINPKTKHFAAYLFWGVCTTAVNVGVFTLLRGVSGLPLSAANAAAWFMAVSFAFVVNRQFVFDAADGSRTTVIGEFSRFVVSRLFSGAVDIILMEIAVTAAHLPELPSKIAVNIIVIILNYVLSKFFVFTRGRT